MMKYRTLLTVLLFTGFISAAQEQLGKNDAEHLKDRLEGYYDNQEQSRFDLSYPNTTLHIKEITLKDKHAEGYWLYIEQSPTSSPDRPDMQQIWHLYKKDKEILVLQPYALNNPLRFTGGWQDASLFKKLRMDSLTERTGCAIYLNKDKNGNFYGGSFGKDCINGADTYTTTEMSIYPAMLVWWDRAWNKKNDQQMAGPEKAGYRFRKFTNARKAKED